jgi:hypothetical protein
LNVLTQPAARSSASCAAKSCSAAAALNKLNVRFSAGNDRLAQLVRKDQDLAAEAERFDRAIVEAVAAGSTFEQRSLKLSEESGVVIATLASC